MAARQRSTIALSRYQYGVLNRNPTISDANRDLLIETLRCISEILIWGDQNDSSVFEYVISPRPLAARSRSSVLATFSNVAC